MKFLVIFFLLLAVSFGVNAQKFSDTLDEFLLKEKKKTSNDERINTYSQGQKIVVLDNAVLQQYQQQNLSQLLSQQTSVFIKSYGFNGLATMNIRGASAAQSQVLWNGVPITNAALGMADISSFPVFFIQQMQLVYGSSGSLFGSGNLGGTVAIETNQPKFLPHKKANIFLGAGSFGQFQIGGKLEWANKKWSYSTGILHQSALNNFSYRDDSDKTRTTSNARMKAWSSVSNIAYKPNEKNTLSLSLWWQQYDRQIPAAMFESFSAKERKDNTFRVLLDWQHHAPIWKWYAKTSLMRDVMMYEDATIPIVSNLRSYQSYSEVGIQGTRLHHSWLLFTPVQVSWMPVDATTKYLTQSAIVAAYQFKWNLWQLTANTRISLVNEQKIWLGGFTLNYQANEKWLWRFNLQKTHRTPSLNELYYSPGGNPNLKPEQGWNEEIGYKWTMLSHEKTNLVQDVSLYHRDINNWIYWMGGAIWTPHNMATVSSSGLEIDHALIHSGSVKWTIGLNTSFVKAITTQSDIPNDGSIGKQIPYTPIVNAVFHAIMDYKHVTFQLNQTYTGIRYFNTDETGTVNDYCITNLSGNYATTIFQKDCRFNLQLNNLLNSHYEVVSRRPMPGINFLCGISCTL